MNLLVGNLRYIRLEKTVLLQKLSKFSWLTPTPSSSNFILYHVTGHFSAAVSLIPHRNPRIFFYVTKQIALLLRKAGVLIRYFSTPVLKDYIRISVGRPSDTDKLVEVLSGIENTWKMLDDYVPQALIFDMDGVIADVSMSYRTAILETAKSYGAEITHSDINDAKAAGNANNDWILTQRLITNYFNKHGTGKAVPSLEEVTKKFEGMLLLAGNKQLLMFATDMYQGIPGVPGLREMEKLLVALEEFETFNLHVPLAIVTGRPRSDAVTFLKTHNIEHLFQYLVSSAFLYIYDFV